MARWWASGPSRQGWARLHRTRRVTRLRSVPTGGSPTKRARRRPGAAPRGMASDAGGPSPPRPGPMRRSGSDSRMASSPGSPSASRPPAGAGIASSRSRTERSPLPSSLSHNARMACGAAVVTRASVIVAMTTRSNLARAYAARPVSQTRHIRCARRRGTARGAPPTRAGATGRSGATQGGALGWPAAAGQPPPTSSAAPAGAD
jgi:hypothetical protein